MIIVQIFVTYIEYNFCFYSFFFFLTNANNFSVKKVLTFLPLHQASFRCGRLVISSSPGALLKNNISLPAKSFYYLFSVGWRDLNV